MVPHESQLRQLFSLLCSIAGTCTKKTSWHVMQGRVKPKHDSCTTRLSWPARTAYDRQGNNEGIDARLNTWKEHEGTNCTQWISIIYDWLILAACFCLLLLHANVQHLRAQKYGSSQKSHSYRLVSPVSRNRDNASIWTDPWHEQGMNEYNIIIYIYTHLILHLWYPQEHKICKNPTSNKQLTIDTRQKPANTWQRQTWIVHHPYHRLPRAPLNRYEVGTCKFMGRAAELPCTWTAISRCASKVPDRAGATLGAVC